MGRAAVKTLGPGGRADRSAFEAGIAFKFKKRIIMSQIRKLAPTEMLPHVIPTSAKCWLSRLENLRAGGDTLPSRPDDNHIICGSALWKFHMSSGWFRCQCGQNQSAATRAVREATSAWATFIRLCIFRKPHWTGCMVCCAIGHTRSCVLTLNQ